MRLGVFVGSSALQTATATAAAGISTQTPWGDAAAEPVVYAVGDHELVLLARHGAPHVLAPHQINYRANVWLMNALGVDAVIGTYTVGGIAPELRVGDLVLPHQFIDYSWGREGTFDDALRHIDFSYPCDVGLRQGLLAVAPQLVGEGVYGCTQGPRLETAAEIRRMAADGCSIVGMTAMPEAALCRELALRYAGLCLVVNPAAGVGVDPREPMVQAQAIDMAELRQASRRGATQMLAVLERLVVRPLPRQPH